MKKKFTVVDKIGLLPLRWGGLLVTDEHTFVDYKPNQDMNYIENVPTSNFIINAATFSTKDNRGFSIRIGRKNVLFLINHCRIIDGRIAEPCQYVKLRRNTYFLMPCRLV